MVEATTLLGRYRLDDQPSTGGMGSVYAGIDERLNRKVAVKVLKGQLADDPRFVERFRREARAVAALSHPNIAGIFDYGEDDGKHFIVMEYVEGRDLARIIREESTVAPERAARIGAQICAALGHAHNMEIVHRDIKPANVIVAQGDHVKVTDFGIARAAGESTITATGSMLGTAQYLSPEQASGGRVGPPSDIYSAGLVLFEMLTGSVPFTGDSAVAIAMRHVSDDVPAPSSVNKDVPPELDDIVAAATAKDPNDRWSTAFAMAEALREATRDTEPAVVAGAGGGTAVLPPEPATTRDDHDAAAPVPGAWTPQRMGRTIALALAALLLLLGAILVANLMGDEDPASERQEEPGGAGAPAQPEETPAESPASYTIEERLIGIPFTEAKEYLEKDPDLAHFEFVIVEEKVENDAEKDLVVNTEPGPGTQVGPGSTITLLVSEGPQEDEGEGPPDEPPGQDKNDKEKEEDD
jgi:eukaryotic-like serine/threonine-protein kinase